ncbi:MAG: hypothetical protein R3B97_17225 [Dehalococcoidia bacterium]|nr:hypothetical protein [Dehalococcoidia bacterium]MCA9829528.1 hypothetical protein [Dehalococcoidia bacterium]
MRMLKATPRAIGRLLRRVMIVSVATATITVLMFVLDAVLLKDRDRRPLS